MYQHTKIRGSSTPAVNGVESVACIDISMAWGNDTDEELTKVSRLASGGT